MAFIAARLLSIAFVIAGMDIFTLPLAGAMDEMELRVRDRVITK